MKYINLNKSFFYRLLILFCIYLLLGINLYSKRAEKDNKQLTSKNSSLNFFVLSDWGRESINDLDKKTPGQLKISKQLGITAEYVKPQFLVTVGDNFHGNGVPSVDDALWKINFEEVYNAKSLMIPWYITLGNHDYKGNVQAELDYALKSNRWTQPARYYSFEKKIEDGSTILFIILDTSPWIEKYYIDESYKNVIGQDTSAQRKWFEETMLKSSAKWKFVFGHHPAYSASGKHGSTPEIQKAFVSLFNKYNIDAVFSGHDHDLQHSHPKNSTVEYFGVGGGSEIRASGRKDFTKFSMSSLGFAVVSVESSKVNISFVNEKGQVLYKFEKIKK